MLLDPRSLDDCLAEICSRCPVAVSIKTRMGVERTEEFSQILEIYNKYPIKRLIIHARARAGMYKSAVDLPAFLAEGLGEQAAMARLKELWFYMLYKFPDSKKEAKALLKAQRLGDYSAAVEALFAIGKFDSSSFFWQ